MLALWNTSTDKIEYWQWFKGRVYERRCDLSPSGELLMYFAAKFRGPMYSWSAVSRPPYFTALALWQKGDAWGGGGMFLTENRIVLNHDAAHRKLAEGFALRRRMHIEAFGAEGRGEDDPLWSARLSRSGWKLLSQPGEVLLGMDSSYSFDRPVQWRKSEPSGGANAIEISYACIHETNGPWYPTEHSVIGAGGECEPLGRADWAFDGDLLFAKEGCLYPLEGKGKQLLPVHRAKKIVDLSGLKFENHPAPNRALDWPSA